MGQKQSLDKEFVEKLKKTVSENKRKLNILIVGPQASGKSSFLNTFLRVVGGSNTLPIPTGKKGERTTVSYRKIVVNEWLTFFDSPGFEFKAKLEQSMLPVFMKGYREFTDLPTSKDSVKLEALLKDPQNVNTKNKIDFCLIIFNATVLQKMESSLVFFEKATILKNLRKTKDASTKTEDASTKTEDASTETPDYSHYEKIVTTLQDLHTYKCSPMFVFTKLDKVEFSHKNEQIAKLFEATAAQNTMYFITNYTKVAQPINQDTDNTIYLIIAAIIEALRFV